MSYFHLETDPPVKTARPVIALISVGTPRQLVSASAGHSRIHVSRADSSRHISSRQNHCTPMDREATINLAIIVIVVCTPVHVAAIPICNTYQALLAGVHTSTTPTPSDATRRDARLVSRRHKTRSHLCVPYLFVRHFYPVPLPSPLIGPFINDVISRLP